MLDSELLNDSLCRCFYTRSGVGPRSSRVVEQVLYRGYNFFSQNPAVTIPQLSTL